MNPAEHLVVVPIVLPLAAGAAMLVIDERRVGSKAAMSLAAAFALVIASALLLTSVDRAGTHVYRLGDWAPPFGIVLVADRLGALMTLLASILGLTSLTFSLARWHRAGPRLHALIQFLMMGVNGAFLTGDLFNLFVFFEVLLAASYGLALHGSGTARVRSGMHYIAVNLAASLLFLIGAALIYGSTGTLNMAHIAQLVGSLAERERALFETGAAILGIAFLVKAGMWPLCFWLTPTYSAASAPAAALFALLTKVGVYVVLRTWLLFFGPHAGASAGFAAEWLVIGGIATLAFGAVGVIASQDTSRLASYSLIVSSGTLIAAIGAGNGAVLNAALYYLLASTLGASALFLLVELMQRGRPPGANVLDVTREAFGEPDFGDDEEPIGIAIPAAIALLGVSYACCALLLAGLPPLAGFVGKFALLHALLDVAHVPAESWILFTLILLSGLSTLVAATRAGVRRFWASQDTAVPRVLVIEMAPVVVLLALCGALTIEAAPVMRYIGQATEALGSARYIDHVLMPQ